MKKNTRLSGMILLGIALTASGCGKDMQPEIHTENISVSISENQVSNQSQVKRKELENKLSTSELSIDEYISLATLYKEEKLIRKQRDLLEKCVRLTGDAEVFRQLQEIVVNAKEENEAMNHEFSRLSDYMGTEEYRGEAVGILMTNEWEQMTMPKMKQGKRNYYYEDLEKGNSLYIEVGYQNDGSFYSKVWRTTNEGSLSFLSKFGQEVKMYMTGYEESMLEGAFTQWTCNGDTGNVIKMEGNFQQNVCVGDFITNIYTGKGNVDLFALWNTKDQLAFEEYRGTFDNNGFPAVEQLSNKEYDGSKPLLVYAFNADRSKYLYITFEDAEEISNFLFQSSVFGMEFVPHHEKYDPVQISVSENGTDTENSHDESIQIRVHDSNIEWFNGTNWVVIGSVEEISKNDPFNSYEDGKVIIQTGEETDIPSPELSKTPSVGEVKKPSTSSGNSTTNKKPSTQKPSTQPPVNQTPTQPSNPTTPTQPSTPTTPSQPTTPLQPSTPTTPSQPSTPSTPSTPSQGESDIEWTDDIL